MGFKYQLLSCRQPQELLLVTLNHLHEVRKMVRVVADQAQAAACAAHPNLLPRARTSTPHPHT
eukprot:scaffold66018_cov26-Tisochrysis_lutea.AAC.2